MMTSVATVRQIGSGRFIMPIRAQVSPPRNVLPAQGMVAMFPENRKAFAGLDETPWTVSIAMS